MPIDLPRPPCAALLGWTLTDQDPEHGWIRIAFDGKAEFLNPAGFIQGGIQTAMLDDTMGPAVWIHTAGTLYTASINMTVSFLAPARQGRLFGEGMVVQLGKTIAFLEAKLMDAEGKLLARATSTARLIPAARALG
jgi:uncharacterized protein (TIGR00369 family)